MNSNPKTILIAEDDHDIRRLLISRCSQLGLRTINVDDATEAIEIAKKTFPDVICVDVDFSGGNGIAVSEMLAEDQGLASIPLVMISRQIDVEYEHQGTTHSACNFSKSPGSWSRLEPLLCDILEIPHANSQSKNNVPATNEEPGEEAVGTPEELLDTVLGLIGNDVSLHQDCGPEPLPWVLCIDDDIDFSIGLSKKLESHGFGVINAYDGREGCHAAKECPPDVILLDYNMPHGRGDAVLKRLKSAAATRDIPVIVLTGESSPSVKLNMMNLGAAAYFTKPVDFVPFVNRLLVYLGAKQRGKFQLESAHNGGSKHVSNGIVKRAQTC